jgi:hypothetical protein
VRSHVVDLTSAFEAMKTTLTKIETNNQEELALANARARLRMVSKGRTFTSSKTQFRLSERDEI